jgi:hypothetical protein
MDTFHMYSYKLLVKIEEDRLLLGSDRAVCLEMVQSIPAEKQPRVNHWFQTGGPNRNHNWRELFAHFKDQFEDKEATQKAGSQLTRMRQGSAQAFSEYLQDFELLLQKCGGLEWAPRSKIIHLNTGINPKLRAALVSKTMPDDDYDKWVTKARIVAGRLEDLPNYREGRGATYNTQYIGSQFTAAPHTSSAPAGPSAQGPGTVDATGDTIMGGMNGLSVNNLATFIAALQHVQNNGGWNTNQGGSTLPRAPWRSSAEMNDLMKRNLCVRCKEKGHIGRKCGRFRGAIPPGGFTNQKPSQSRGPSKRINNMETATPELESEEESEKE